MHCLANIRNMWKLSYQLFISAWSSNQAYAGPATTVKLGQLDQTV